MTEEANSAPAWRVTPIRANTIDVAITSNPDYKYQVKATRKDLRLQAFVKEQLVEEICLTRGIREYLLDIEVESGALRLATSSTHDVMETYVINNSEEFLVSSSPVEHGFRLAAELKKRNIPKAPVLKLLIDEIRAGGALLADIQKSTQFGPNVLVRNVVSNGGMAACSMECFLCALGYEFGCLACNLCVQMAMP